MPSPTASELAGSMVSKLLYLSAGMFVSILVAFIVVKLVAPKSRTLRKALFTVVGGLGFVLSWYLAFRPHL